jgi:hypothetical protein
VAQRAPGLFVQIRCPSATSSDLAAGAAAKTATTITAVIAIEAMGFAAIRFG